MKSVNRIAVYSLAGIMLLMTGISCHPEKKRAAEEARPHIVNIINFIRQCEPRIEWITEEVLYQTVVSQVEIMKQYDLPGTFLLQYDALIDPRYSDLLKSLPRDKFEIGAWWEIPQPLVENSGLTWRGRYPWDWHADVGFATGYTPQERELLTDTYMAEFMKIFGYYPKSVGSWFIDAHTLLYMYEKYGIIASCNCKDQIGTDGYTLWGGYWNQAYYPSKKNAYMPAQNAENQIPVPIFRMLGSDPIHQYDKGLGGSVQTVQSLEPVYTKGGGNEEWCNWYYNEFVEGSCMEFAYVQTGQENSFTWKKMKQGFDIQMPILSRLRAEGKAQVLTLAETGKWFKEKYPVTPATSVTVLRDHSDQDLKTVWFNSRFYRANLLWEKGTLRFRDIHLFDENIPSDYLTAKGTSTDCYYYTLPVVDGFEWSNENTIAGLRFKAIAGKDTVDMVGTDPEVDDSREGVLKITWPVVKPAGTIIITFNESSIEIKSEGKELKEWFLQLSPAKEKMIPVQVNNPETLALDFRGNHYTVHVESGSFAAEEGGGYLIFPNKKELRIKIPVRSQ